MAMPTKHIPLRILRDTREQKPYAFERFGVECIPATLDTGDYSLPGFEDRVAVERKSIDDLIGCLMGSDRARFERELSRGARYDLFCVVVESSLEDISKGRFKSNMKPHAALQSIFAFQVRYRVPFIWASNRAGGEYVTHSLLSKYLEEIEKRYRKAIDAEPKESTQAKVA